MIKSYTRLHVDISSAVVVAAVVVIVYRPLSHALFAALGFFKDAQRFPAWIGDFALNIASDIVAALIIVPIAVWILRIRGKAAAAGVFEAFDIAGSTETIWGETTLTYNLFSDRIHGRLVKAGEPDRVELYIEAVLHREHYLRGHYIEITKLTRRRQGSFLLELDASGNDYVGPYVFVDPNGDGKPQTGSVRWKRKT